MIDINKISTFGQLSTAVSTVDNLNLSSFGYFYDPISDYVLTDCIDAYVWEETPNTNYGDSTEVALSNFEQAARRFAFLYWDLSSVDPITLSDAKIELNCIPSDPMNFPQGPFNLYFSNRPWTSTGLTYYHFNEFTHGDSTKNRWYGQGVLDSTNFDSTPVASNIMISNSGISAIHLNEYGLNKLTDVIYAGGNWNGFMIAGTGVNHDAQWGGKISFEASDSSGLFPPSLYLYSI